MYGRQFLGGRQLYYGRALQRATQWRRWNAKVGLKLDDGWPESEKDVFQAALSMVVEKIVGEWLVNCI